MNKKEKVIGSVIMLIGCTIFLLVGYILSKPKAYNNDIFTNNNISEGYKDNIIVDNSKITSLNSETEENFKKIVVEIKGEVKNPNVYTMEYGSRAYDLINKAGGYTEKADELSINASMKLRDEDCIIIYNKEDRERKELPIGINNVSRTDNIEKSTLNNGKININTASKEELMTLPGIGEVTAERIIDYRESKGNFNSVEELTKVERIGEKTLDKFKDKIEAR